MSGVLQDRRLKSKIERNMVLLKQLLIFLFMMVLGYGMAKTGIMEEKACSAINWMLVNIANPALVISSSIGNAIEKGSWRIQMPDRIRQYRIYGISDDLCRLRSTGTDLRCRRSAL